MFDVGHYLPVVTDEDIDYVCSLMGLDALDEPRRAFLKCRSTMDVSACPGSGKTTLVVAKLAILARKWPNRTRGICVLSHTNVAREQIECRLGNTVVGQRLLSYPHFIDTIHGFVNRFMALPWLYSNGFPSPTIDDNVTTAYRRRVLANKDYWMVASYLGKKYKSFDNLRICGRDLSFEVGGKPFPAGKLTKSYRLATQAVEATATAGYFCYDEMFVWADALLEDHPEIPVWLGKRFPLVLVDEMQDTHAIQTELLDRIFPRDTKSLIVQRVGDPNQQIFDFPGQSDSSTSSFPDADESRCLEFPNSYRFGPEIAALASPFAVRPVGTEGLCGIGPKKVGPAVEPRDNAVFVFPDNTTHGVLDAFGKHVLAVLGPELAAEGPVTAVGHIHKPDDDVKPGHANYPKTISHYWDGYTAESSNKDPHPQSLVKYVRAAQSLVADGRLLSPGVEKIAGSVLELARRIGDLGELKGKSRTHRTLLGVLDDRPAALQSYREILVSFVIEKRILLKVEWPSYRERFLDVASAVCVDVADKSRAERFLLWPEDDISLSVDGDPTRMERALNTYRVSDGDHCVDIRLGTVHSVKGQSHVATLLLSTNWHGMHSSKRMMPWLIGENVNGTGVGSRDKQRLLNSYVAMTRPSQLLCLAVPQCALGGEPHKNVQRLKSRGWRVAAMENGKAYWFK